METDKLIVPKLVFIIPYRDRKHHKTHFEVYINYLLEDIPDTDYEIFFSHQCDNRPFNRGATKNIGFLAIKQRYPHDYKNITFVFNDIDTLPCKKNLLNYRTIKGVVKHFYGHEFALGGIFSIKGSDFEKINGFPNLWGWGVEDNSINHRALINNLFIDRSNFYKIGSEEITQLLDQPYRLIANKEMTKLKKLDIGLNTIYNLKYYINNEFINIIKFDVENNVNDDDYYTDDVSQPNYAIYNDKLGKEKLKMYEENLSNNRFSMRYITHSKQY